jgi:hypothetical protein
MGIRDSIGATISSVSGYNFIISLSDKQTKFSDIRIKGLHVFFFSLRGDFTKYVKRK